MRPPRAVTPHTDDRDTGIARIRGILAEENLDDFSNDELLDACIDLAPSRNAEPDAIDHQITRIQEMIDEDHLDEFSNDQTAQRLHRPGPDTRGSHAAARTEPPAATRTQRRTVSRNAATTGQRTERPDLTTSSENPPESDDGPGPDMLRGYKDAGAAFAAVLTDAERRLITAPDTLFGFNARFTDIRVHTQYRQDYADPKRA